MIDQAELTGWVDEPEQVAAVAAEQPFPVFGDTPAGNISEADLPDHVYLWKAREQLTGKPWPSRNQGSVGSCVSFGTVAAVEATCSAEILAGQPEELKDLVQEVVYALSRVEVNGGRVPFRGDGSIGAWAAKAVKTWGVLDRAIHGTYDLRTYDEKRCRSWGSSGVPDDLEPTVKRYPVQGITLVKTWTEAKKALAQGFGIAVCSSQGFSMTRGPDGFAKPVGSWAHCMALLGYRTQGREGGWICNSWGPSAHTGPVGDGNPPTCGFWAEAQVVERMLSQGDSWAFSAVQGFPARMWFI